MTTMTRTRPGAWIPWIFVLAFAVVVAVNAVFITLALRTWPGLATENAYERGLAHNEVIAEQQRQDTLGWRVMFGFRAAGPGSQAGEITLEIRDRDGRAVNDARAILAFTRPLEPLAAIEREAAPRGGGYYAAFVELPRAGQWDVHLVLRGGDGRIDLRRRIHAP